MRRILLMGAVVLGAAACRGEGSEEYPVIDPPEPAEELSMAADTAEEEFSNAGGTGVIAVQGGRVLGGPFTATGTFRNTRPNASPGAVTVTEVEGGTRLLLSLDGYQAGGQIQATVVRGRCGEDGEVVHIAQPAITVGPNGLANYEATIPLPTRALFDGMHTFKIVPAPASEGLQDAGGVLACAELQEVEAG